MYSRIVGTGSYLPERVVHNTDLEKIMETSDTWIRERTGIERRHYAAEGQTTVDMAELAARRALDAAGLAPTDVDLIVFGTTTPDLVFPNAGAETLTRITDFTDRTTAILFADGAGAVLLEAADAPGVISTHLHADGSYQNLLYCTGGISRGYEPGSGNRAVIRMAGREVFKIAVTMLGSVVDEALAANKLQKSDINWLVPHQANIRIIQAVARKLDLPMERVIVTVQDQGNTSAASVPLALDKGVRDGRIQPGDLILLEAFGGGLTWGAALIRM